MLIINNLISLILIYYLLQINYNLSIILILITIINIAYLLINKNIKKDYLNPQNIFILIFLLYSMSSFIKYYNFYLYQHDNSYSLYDFYIYGISIIISLLGFNYGFNIISYKKIILFNFNQKIKYINYKKTLLYLLIIIILLFILNYFLYPSDFNFSNIISYKEIAASKRLEWRSDYYSGIKRYIFSELKTILILNITFLLYSIYPKWKKLIIVLQLLIIICFIKLGNRGILIQLICFYILYNYYIKGKLNIYFFIILPLIFILLIMIAHARVTTDIIDMANISYILLLDNWEILLPTNVGELVNPPRSLLNIINAININELSYLMGSGTINEFLTFIPKAIFVERPLPMVENYIMYFYPLLYDQGKGLAFFLPAFGYWEFGLIGILIEMILYGAIISYVYQIFINNKSNYIILLMYNIFLTNFIIFGIRNTLIGNIKTTIMSIIIINLIAILSINNKNKSKRF